MYAYNPRKKTYRQLQESIVGNDRLDILDTIRDEMNLKKKEGPKQHWILIGPRGIGKSHLMTLLYYQVKNDSKLSKKWIPILFPEELRMERSLYKILARALREVVRELGIKKKAAADDLEQKINLAKTAPISERADYYFTVMSWFYEETGKHILLLAENLQYVLGKKLSNIEQKKLRAFLQTSKALLIFGSATTVFDALHDHSRPFYHFFHVKRLKELNLEDMKTLIGNVLSEKRYPEVSEKLVREDARLNAFYAFTGGNPRMAIFLAEILSIDVPDEMNEVMDRMLDELTPYFESIVNGIPDYLEEVVNTLAAYEPAQSPKEIAQHMEIPQTSVRNYLKQLKDLGYVRVAFSNGKSNYYCLNEYLFRIWFQMRDDSHREETRWLLELLLTIYSTAPIPEEVKKERVSAAADHNPSSYKSSIGETTEFMESNPEYCKVMESCVNSSGETDNSERLSTLYRHMDRFMGNKKSVSEFNLGIVLIFFSQLDSVQAYFDHVLKKTLNDGKDKKAKFVLFVSTLRACTLLRLSQRAIQDVKKLTKIYSDSVKSMETLHEIEREVLDFSLELLALTRKRNIDRGDVKLLLMQLRDEAVPFSDTLFKVGVCMVEPDSLEAKRYMSEKIIAKVIERFKQKEIATEWYTGVLKTLSDTEAAERRIKSLVLGDKKASPQLK